MAVIHRLEDLGIVKDRLEKVLESIEESYVGTMISSKHSLEPFIEYYKSPETLGQLFWEIRRVKSQLDEIANIAHGEIK